MGDLFTISPMEDLTSLIKAKNNTFHKIYDQYESINNALEMICGQGHDAEWQNLIWIVLTIV